MENYTIAFRYENDDEVSHVIERAYSPEEAKEKFLKNHTSDSFWIDIISVDKL